jgi:hypothetical protein
MSRSPNTTVVAEEVFEQVANRGLLLQSGIGFPSATTTICGSPVSGSWWSHPKSSLIHRVLEELDDHPDLTTAKLINGKVTIVHFDLWPSLVSVGRAREPWQMARLSPLAKSLLKKARAECFRLDDFRSRLDGKPSDAVRTLEKKLLVHTHEIHTDQGKHTKVVRSWDDWWGSDNRSQPEYLPGVGEAKATFEAAVNGFGVKLPW